MAKHILRDAYVSINGVNLSDHVDSVEVDWDIAVEDITAMGASGRGKLAGLEDDKFSVNWLQDFAAASVDATLSALVRAAAFAFEIRPVNAARSTTNPAFTGNAILSNYAPVSGDVGSAHKVKSDFEVDGIISRLTA